MSLTPGTRLGPYEVAVQIGEGGMGQVYRATDTPQIVVVQNWTEELKRLAPRR